MRQGPPIASWILWVLSLVLAVGCGLFFVRHCPGEKEPEPDVEVRVDTLYLWDTIRVSTPVPVAVRVVDTLYVPVPVPMPGRTDTVWAELPREEKVYSGLTYRAVVSGVYPSLDSISVYNQVQFIHTTERIRPSRWSVGIQAGYGASKDGLTPYLGVGVTYTLWAPGSRKAPP